MRVGICRVDLHIASVQSLKQKRGIVKSIKARLSNKFNISVAEVDHLDKWQRAALGVAVVGSDTAAIDRTFSYIENFISQDFRVQIIGWDKRVV